jgi:acetyl esterase/lipase
MPTPRHPFSIARNRFLSAAGLCLAALAALAVPRLAAAEKANLERQTPVPAGEPVPISDFFRPRLLQEPKLNSSGTHIAAIITAAEDRHQLLVYELKTKKIEMVSGLGDQDIRQVHWLNDQRLVFQLSAKKMYGIGLFAANVGSIHDAYPLFQHYGSQLIAVPRQSRLQPLVWNSYDGLEDGRDLGVAVVNTGFTKAKFINLLGAELTMEAIATARDSNERHITDRYPVPEAGLAYDYLADKEGRLAFAFTAQDGVLALHRLVAKHWEKCPVDLEYIDVVGCGNEPGQLVVVGPRQGGKPRALLFLDAATGKPGDVLLQDTAYDFDGWLYRDPASHDIVGAIYERNGPQVVWFNEGYRNLQKVLDGFFPGVVVRILGSDEAGKLFLVATYSDREPAIYSWVDLEKRTVGLIKNSAPWIDPKRMLPESIIKFKTRDGLRLDAYLTMPAGASKQNPPPLVVLPHGGPWVRDTWGFNGEVQFLASRGYAVLQPNYRGSTGYDWMFPDEDLWGFRKMHDDVTDATKAMVASGLIDGGRVAIMGGSFGGYLAVSGVVHEPALYRCAVTIAGVFDWEQQIKDKKYDRYENPTFGRMIRKLGDPKQQPEKFAAISPLRQVDQIRVPVFVSHGKDDPVVDIGQSRRLISELENHHVTHESLLVGEEGHGMGHLDNQIELYTRIEAFLAKYLMPPTAVGTP